MGVDITPIKIGRKLKDYNPNLDIDDIEDDGIIINNFQDYSPIEHLPKVTEGIYELLGYVEDYSVSCSYSGYNTFRRLICKSVYGLEPEDIWINTSDYIDSPFIELIHFSDSQGFFDYEVAEKLLGEFKNNLYKNKFLAFLEFNTEDTRIWLSNLYEDYTNLLKKTVELKGVVQYC